MVKAHPDLNDISNGNIHNRPAQRQTTLQSPIPVGLSQRSNKLQPAGSSGNQGRSDRETDWVKAWVGVYGWRNIHQHG